jgi:hypothetical protein
MSDLSDLFDKDPLKLTAADKTEIVRAYREAQHKFNLGEKMAGATKKVAPKAPKLDLNLDDILKDL